MHLRGLLVHIYVDKTSLIELMNRRVDGAGSLVCVSRPRRFGKSYAAIDNFQNDFESFESADDVLTLLVHLGYLKNHEDERKVQIPNEEVRIEFRQFLSQKNMNSGWVKLMKRSQKLLEDSIGCHEDDVAAALNEIRQEQYAPQLYNNEQALRVLLNRRYKYLKIYRSSCLISTCNFHQKRVIYYWVVFFCSIMTIMYERWLV